MPMYPACDSSVFFYVFIKSWIVFMGNDDETADSGSLRGDDKALDLRITAETLFSEKA